MSTPLRKPEPEPSGLLHVTTPPTARSASSASSTRRATSCGAPTRARARRPVVGARQQARHRALRARARRPLAVRRARPRGRRRLRGPLPRGDAAGAHRPDLRVGRHAGLPDRQHGDLRGPRRRPHEDRHHVAVLHPRGARRHARAPAWRAVSARATPRSIACSPRWADVARVGGRRDSRPGALRRSPSRLRSRPLPRAPVAANVLDRLPGAVRSGTTRTKAAVDVFVEAATAIHATGSGTGAGVSYSAAVSGAEGEAASRDRWRRRHRQRHRPRHRPRQRLLWPRPPHHPAHPRRRGFGVVAAALAVGLTWTLVRRRRRLASDTRQYCSLHPEDALCGAA